MQTGIARLHTYQSADLIGVSGGGHRRWVDAPLTGVADAAKGRFAPVIATPLAWDQCATCGNLNGRHARTAARPPVKAHPTLLGACIRTTSRRVAGHLRAVTNLKRAANPCGWRMARACAGQAVLVCRPAQPTVRVRVARGPCRSCRSSTRSLPAPTQWQAWISSPTRCACRPPPRQIKLPKMLANQLATSTPLQCPRWPRSQLPPWRPTCCSRRRGRRRSRTLPTAARCRAGRPATSTIATASPRRSTLQRASCTAGRTCRTAPSSSRPSGRRRPSACACPTSTTTSPNTFPTSASLARTGRYYCVARMQASV